MVTIDVKGFDEVRAALAAVPGALRRPLMLGLDAILKNQVAETFARQADPVLGVEWKRTGPLTLSLRPSGGGQTLRASGGGLLDSIVSRAPQVTETTVTIGTNKPYGPIHQNGGTIHPRNAEKLAIPLTREAAKAGSARRWIARQRKGSYFFTAGAIMSKPARGGRPVAVFARLDSVTIPQRRYLGIGPKQAAEIEAFVVAVARKAIAGGAR